MALTDKNRVVENFLHLTTIDNPSLNERKMADEIIKQLNDLGIKCTEDDTYKLTGSNAGNIYAFIDGTIGTPVLFSAHLDAVDPAVNKKAVLHEDGLITSDGNTVLAADDLAGIAEILEAVRYIKENNLKHRPIELLFTYAEELYDVGSERFDYSKIRSKEAYVLDTTGNIGKFIYKSPSIISFEAEFTGKAVHAGFRPENGIHAIKIASEAVFTTKMGRVDSDMTVNIGRIDGGNGTNIVPEKCIVKGEVRSHDHEKALSEIEKIKKNFASCAEKEGGKLSFKFRTGCRAYETSLQSKTVRKFKSVCEKNGYEFTPDISFGGSDNNVFVQHGIEGIVISCAMKDVHSTKESILSSEMVKAADSVVYLACEE